MIVDNRDGRAKNGIIEGPNAQEVPRVLPEPGDDAIACGLTDLTSSDQPQDARRKLEDQKKET